MSPYTRARDFYVILGTVIGDTTGETVYVESHYYGNSRWRWSKSPERAACFLERSEALKTARYLSKKKPGRSLRVVRIRVLTREQQVWPKPCALTQLGYLGHELGAKGVIR